MGKMIHLTSADGAQIAAYEATPAEGPQGAAAPVRGAVVVLQEIFGLNRHIRNVADGYAKAGYFVIAPAMFIVWLLASSWVTRPKICPKASPSKPPLKYCCPSFWATFKRPLTMRLALARQRAHQSS